MGGKGAARACMASVMLRDGGSPTGMRITCFTSFSCRCPRVAHADVTQPTGDDETTAERDGPEDAAADGRIGQYDEHDETDGVRTYHTTSTAVATPSPLRHVT